MQNMIDTEIKSTTNKADFLVIEKVTKSYETPEGVYQVLDEIDFTVAPGEFICVIGHSGCGKSTLLNMVAGFSQPTTGEVRLQGKKVEDPELIA